MSQTLWPAKPRKVDRSLLPRPKKDKNHNLSWHKAYIIYIIWYIMNMQRLLRDRFWQLVDKLEKKVLLALYKLHISWFFRHIQKMGEKNIQFRVKLVRSGPGLDLGPLRSSVSEVFRFCGLGPVRFKGSKCCLVLVWEFLTRFGIDKRRSWILRPIGLGLRIPNFDPGPT